MDIQPDASTARSRLYPPSPPESRKIRVVALVSHLSGPTWIAEALAAIAESDVAELLVVAVDPRGIGIRRRHGSRSVSRGRSDDVASPRPH